MEAPKKHSGFVLRALKLPYAEALDMQNDLFQRRMRNEIPDVLLITEHPPVYTFGKNADARHLLLDETQVKARGIDLFWIDRGGDITFHGPGQLVGYPILDLHGYYRDVGRFLREIEEVLIHALARFNIAGSRVPGLTGVWVGDAKIAAIGVKLSRWVSKHGFALNVNTDLSYFSDIVPCGIRDKAVTSMQKILDAPVPFDAVIDAVIESFASVFSIAFTAASLPELVAAGQA